MKAVLEHLAEHLSSGGRRRFAVRGRDCPAQELVRYASPRQHRYRVKVEDGVEAVWRMEQDADRCRRQPRHGHTTFREACSKCAWQCEEVAEAGTQLVERQ